MSAIVLGVGPGLGLALASAYAETGRTVALVARSQEQVQQYAEQIGHGAIGLAADLSDPAQVRDVIDRAAAQMGPVDLIHYNASVLIEGTPSQVPLDVVETSWRVGCLGAWAALQAGVEIMSPGSAFFVTGGGLALDPWPPASALGASKAALRNFVLAAAKEQTGLRVAMITINGVIAEGSDLAPTEIARWFLSLLEQTSPAAETVLPQR